MSLFLFHNSVWRYKKHICFTCFKSDNCLKNFKLGVHLKFVHVLNFNAVVINYSKCLKSRERKTSSGVEPSALPKCELFTQMLFVKNSILNLPTASNVISNSQQSVWRRFFWFHEIILAQVHLLRQAISQWIRVTPQVLLTKANEVNYQNHHWIQQIKHC